MAKGLAEIFPPPKELLELEPEDIAQLLFSYLKQVSGQDLHWYNFTLNSGELGQYAGKEYEDVARVVTEAWMFLEREGLLAPKPGDIYRKSFFITRRGRALLSMRDFELFRRGSLLPPKSLDSQLESEVRPLFLRGDYDTAIFRAFKEVEIRVRTAANLPQDALGVKLMRDAFDANNGSLSDKTRPVAEREATAHLFAGAIGLFKNPSSHRDVEFTSEEAADLIRFANYLIVWVERLGTLKTSIP